MGMIWSGCVPGVGLEHQGGIWDRMEGSQHGQQVYLVRVSEWPVEGSSSSHPGMQTCACKTVFVISMSLEVDVMSLPCDFVVISHEFPFLGDRPFELALILLRIESLWMLVFQFLQPFLSSAIAFHPCDPRTPIDHRLFVISTYACNIGV